MAPYRRLGLVLFAIAAAVGMRAASAAAPPASAPAPAPAPAPVMAEEMSIGNPKAKVTIVEYASASCPHCARMNNDVMPAFKKKYVDTGKVRYVLREFLTPPVPFAATAFMMARCAGDKQYFAVLDDVFHEQAAIYDSGDLSGGLLKIGEKHGMSKDQLNACMDAKAVDALKARLDKAEKAGIDSVPTFVVGEQKLVGEKTLDDLSGLVDPALAK